MQIGLSKFRRQAIIQFSPSLTLYFAMQLFQPMDYSEHNKTNNNDFNDNAYTPSPRYSKNGMIKQNTPVNQDYWHPIYVGSKLCC